MQGFTTDLSYFVLVSILPSVRHGTGGPRPLILPSISTQSLPPRMSPLFDIQLPLLSAWTVYGVSQANPLSTTHSSFRTLPSALLDVSLLPDG